MKKGDKAKSGLKHWAAYDGDVRLYEDGTVQHLDDDAWKRGWGPWAPYSLSELPSYRHPDGPAVRAWAAAVQEYRARVPDAPDGAVAIGVMEGDYVIRRVGDYTFGVRLTDRRDAGDLANGARGYSAGVEIYRDGARIGTGRWDAEGLDNCADLDGQPLDLGDGEQIAWGALAEMVREHLATLPGPDAGGLALAL